MDVRSPNWKLLGTTSREASISDRVMHVHTMEGSYYFPISVEYSDDRQLTPAVIIYPDGPDPKVLPDWQPAPDPEFYELSLTQEQVEVVWNALREFDFAQVALAHKEALIDPKHGVYVRTAIIACEIQAKLEKDYPGKKFGKVRS